MSDVQHCVGHRDVNQPAPRPFLVRCQAPCQGRKPCIPTCCDPGEGYGEGKESCKEGAVDLGSSDSSDFFRKLP